MVRIANPTPYTQKIQDLVDVSFACRYGDLARLYRHCDANGCR